MASSGWNRDLFASELTAVLISILNRGVDVDSLERAVGECASAAEEVCRDRPMACRAGCPYCCVLNVAILLPEGMRIAKWLQGRLSTNRLQEVRRRLSDHGSHGRWMDDEERIFKRVTCPFLDGGGSCAIHPVRPLACRAVASLDNESCREAFNPLTAEERLVPADLLRRGAYDMAFVALGRALGHQGIDDRSIELGLGVSAFLECPDASELLLSGGRLPRVLWE